MGSSIFVFQCPIFLKASQKIFSVSPQTTNLNDTSSAVSEKAHAEDEEGCLADILFLNS
jgi:hypothetical protein